MSETRLFIGDVKTCTKEDLERAFAEFGELKEVWVARDPAGFAFVEYFDKEAALAALHEMNNKAVNNDTIRVELSKVKKSASRGEHSRPPYPRRGSGRGSHRGYGPPPPHLSGGRYSHHDMRYPKSAHHPYATPPPPYYPPEPPSRYYDDRGPLPPPPASYHHHSRYPHDRREYDDYYYHHPYPPAPPTSRRGYPPPSHRDNGSSLYASPYPPARSSRYDPYPLPPPHHYYGEPPGPDFDPYLARGLGRALSKSDRELAYERPKGAPPLSGGRGPPPRERPPHLKLGLGGESGHPNSEHTPNQYHRNGYDLPPDPSLNLLEQHSSINRRRNLSSPQARMTREFPNRQYSPREYEKEYPPPNRAHPTSYPEPHRVSPRHY